MSIATCIGCSCDDFHACTEPHSGEPCSWLEVDYDEGKGVCSCCESHLDRWSRGDHAIKMTVAKIVKEGESAPFYIERNGMDGFPIMLGDNVGDKFHLEWVEMTDHEFENLPQFAHIKLAEAWVEAMHSLEHAKHKGDEEKAENFKVEAARLEAEVAGMGFDVRDLIDVDFEEIP